MISADSRCHGTNGVLLSLQEIRHTEIYQGFHRYFDLLWRAEKSSGQGRPRPRRQFCCLFRNRRSYSVNTSSEHKTWILIRFQHISYWFLSGRVFLSSSIPFQDSRIVSLLAQFKDLVELLHISDQYSPEKPNSEEVKLKRPKIERTILLHVNCEFTSINISSVLVTRMSPTEAGSFCRCCEDFR